MTRTELKNKKIKLVPGLILLGSLALMGNFACKKQPEEQQAQVSGPAAGVESVSEREGQGNSVDRMTGGIINRYVPNGQLPPPPLGSPTNPGSPTNLPPPTSPTGPTVPICGDGYLSLGVETCEDGNTVANDGCTNCQLDGPPAPPVCGNHIHEAGEQCDDGNVASNDGCSQNCQIEPPPSPPGGGGSSGIFMPPPDTNPGCIAHPQDPSCAWALVGAFGAIANQFMNFTGIFYYVYNDEGNPFQQVTANMLGEPVEIIFNVFDLDNNLMFKQDARRANLSVPGVLNVLALEFNQYMVGGANAGEIQRKFILTADPNRQMIMGGKQMPGLIVNDFAYSYTDPNFNPLITNSNYDFAALSPVPPAVPSPLAAIQIVEGHEKYPDQKLKRVLKGFKDLTTSQWVRFEDMDITYKLSGLEVGKPDTTTLDYTNCKDDPTGTHCDLNNLTNPIAVAHGRISSQFYYDAQGRLTRVTFNELQGPGPGQPVDLTAPPVKTSDCNVEYWDNPANIPIHRLPQFFKDFGFSETGLIKGMTCVNNTSMQQTFGHEGFYLSFMWAPIWRFIPTATIPQ